MPLYEILIREVAVEPPFVKYIDAVGSELSFRFVCWGEYESRRGLFVLLVARIYVDGFPLPTSRVILCTFAIPVWEDIISSYEICGLSTSMRSHIRIRIIAAPCNICKVHFCNLYIQQLHVDTKCNQLYSFRTCLAFWVWEIRFQLILPPAFTRSKKWRKKSYKKSSKNIFLSNIDLHTVPA